MNNSTVDVSVSNLSHKLKKEEKGCDLNTLLSFEKKNDNDRSMDGKKDQHFLKRFKGFKKKNFGEAGVGGTKVYKNNEVSKTKTSYDAGEAILFHDVGDLKQDIIKQSVNWTGRDCKKYCGIDRGTPLEKIGLTPHKVVTNFFHGDFGKSQTMVGPASSGFGIQTTLGNLRTGYIPKYEALSPAGNKTMVKGGHRNSFTGFNHVSKNKTQTVEFSGNKKEASFYKDRMENDLMQDFYTGDAGMQRTPQPTVKRKSIINHALFGVYEPKSYGVKAKSFANVHRDKIQRIDDIQKWKKRLVSPKDKPYNNQDTSRTSPSLYSLIPKFETAKVNKNTVLLKMISGAGHPGSDSIVSGDKTQRGDKKNKRSKVRLLTAQPQKRSNEFSLKVESVTNELPNRRSANELTNEKVTQRDGYMTSKNITISTELGSHGIEFGQSARGNARKNRIATTNSRGTQQNLFALAGKTPKFSVFCSAPNRRPSRMPSADFFKMNSAQAEDDGSLPIKTNQTAKMGSGCSKKDHLGDFIMQYESEQPFKHQKGTPLRKRGSVYNFCELLNQNKLRESAQKIEKVGKLGFEDGGMAEHDYMKIREKVKYVDTIESGHDRDKFENFLVNPHIDAWVWERTGCAEAFDQERATLAIREKLLQKLENEKIREVFMAFRYEEKLKALIACHSKKTTTLTMADVENYSSAEEDDFLEDWKAQIFELVYDNPHPDRALSRNRTGQEIPQKPGKAFYKKYLVSRAVIEKIKIYVNKFHCDYHEAKR
jgi:hypothetical protein